MKYKLIQPVNKKYSAIEQILSNRGIEETDFYHYLNTKDTDINSYEEFGKDVLWEGARVLIDCIGHNHKALVIVDSDCDGFTSSATLINYLYDLFPAWVNNNLSWFMHSGKQHGLNDVPMELLEDIKLVIVPDAGSNDYIEHKKYKTKGIDILVLDHHEADYVSPDAVIINNQLSNYPNKEMSGVGVVWQFCRYLDTLLDKNNADNYLDLVALGMDADMMSLKSLETKHLIDKGFKQVNNPFFEAMVDKNAFKLKELTPMSVAFYVAPFVNAIVRSGTMEEKEVIFQSMLNFKALEKIPSNKRGHKPGEMEYRYIQATRTATNVKNRQTRAQDAGMALLEALIEDQSLLDHKVLLFLLEPGDIDKNIAGLIANKFMAKYQRPCCILTKVVDINGGDMIPIEDGTPEIKFEPTEIKISYQGSARGCDKTGVTEFKDICESTGCTLFAQGHQGAFGLGLPADKIDEFLAKTDEILKDVSDEAIYTVDFTYKGTEVNPEHILDIARYNYLWGKDMDEPLIAVENLKITKDMLFLMSPDKKPTLKIVLPNKVSILKFNSSQEEYDKLYSETGAVEVNLIGTCNLNDWNGVQYPQLMINDYEIVDKVKYIF